MLALQDGSFCCVLVRTLVERVASWQRMVRSGGGLQRRRR